MSPRPDGPRDEVPREDDLFGPDAIEESLSEALNDLEKILDGQATPEQGAAGDPPAQDRPADEDIEQAQQYTIPLLNDVVIPGIEVNPQSPSTAVTHTDAAPPESLDHAAMMAQLTGPPADLQGPESTESEIDEDTLRRRLAERLASEVEVMVQARLEAALVEVCDDIREQVRNHLDIILPEIVEDMLQHRQSRDD